MGEYQSIIGSARDNVGGGTTIQTEGDGLANSNTSAFTMDSSNSGRTKLKEDNSVEKPTESCESTWVRVRLTEDRWLTVGCVYRSPSNADEENDRMFAEITTMVEQQEEQGDLIYLGGDFNTT